MEPSTQTQPHSASSVEMMDRVEARLRLLRGLLDGFDLEHRRQVVRAAELLIASLGAGGKVLILGNGGSAAEAQHMAAELIGRFMAEREAIPAIALTTDSSVVTSVANDYDYAQVFARQISALGQSGDVLVALSTSGSSPNVVRAVDVAKSKGLATVALLGNRRSILANEVDVAVCMPGGDVAAVQEGHLMVIHMLCALVESGLQVMGWRGRSDGRLRAGETPALQESEREG